MGGGGVSLAAKASKVDICHREGKKSGRFHLINVSTNAQPAHIAHGDALVGDFVPGTNESKKFDASCAQVDVEPPAAICPCALTDLNALGFGLHVDVTSPVLFSGPDPFGYQNCELPPAFPFAFVHLTNGGGLDGNGNDRVTITEDSCEVLENGGTQAQFHVGLTPAEFSACVADLNAAALSTPGFDPGFQGSGIASCEE